MPNFLLTMWDTLNSSNIGILVAVGLGMFAVIGSLAMLSYHYTLGSIKSRTVGNTAQRAGQRIKRSDRPMPMCHSRSESGETVKLSPRSRGWCWAAKVRRMR